MIGPTRLLLAPSVLLIVLGWCGWRLFRNNLILEHQLRAGREIALKNQTIEFSKEAGIDVWGQQVYLMPPVKERATVVFLLRDVSLSADIEFWRKVQGLSTRYSGIRFIAYCDGSLCADHVRHYPSQFDFPVVAYGEAASSQAVVNRDLNGYSIIRREQWLTSKLLQWRSPTQSPQAISDELGKYQ